MRLLPNNDPFEILHRRSTKKKNKIAMHVPTVLCVYSLVRGDRNPESLHYVLYIIRKIGGGIFRAAACNMCALAGARVSRSFMRVYNMYVYYYYYFFVSLSPHPSADDDAEHSPCVRYKHEQLDLPRNYTRRFSCPSPTQDDRRLRVRRSVSMLAVVVNDVLHCLYSPE